MKESPKEYGLEQEPLQLAPLRNERGTNPDPKLRRIRLKSQLEDYH
jgi:hypothetical protein